MAFTYNTGDLTTDLAKVRLLLHDTDSSNPLFQDEEINAMLALEGNNVKRAAALGKETIAGNQVLVLKVIRLMDLSTDGAAVARELRQQAAMLREQAAEEEANDAGGSFDIAEWVVDDFTSRERLNKEALRG